jgi:hypothetical protein
VGDRDEGDVVVPARPGAAFEVVEAERVFELAVVLLDAPAQLRELDKLLQRRVGGEVADPVVGRGVRVGGRFGEQPADGQLAAGRRA